MNNSLSTHDKLTVPCVMWIIFVMENMVRRLQYKYLCIQVARETSDFVKNKGQTDDQCSK